MFAKELKRGKSVASGSPTITNDSRNSFNSYYFDGENLILNYLTYQYLDLTYLPLQQIVNYSGDIRSTVSVSLTLSYSLPYYNNNFLNLG